jgi:hypothetical protein
MAITTASNTAVTISAVTHTLVLAWSVPPDGAAAASPAPRLTVTSPTASQVVRGNGRLFTRLATSSVKGSSMMKMGCTSATGPLASAVAWHSAARMTIAIPASQTLRLIR